MNERPVLWLLWGAIFSSVLFYAALPLWLGGASPNASELPLALPIALVGAACSAAAASFFLRQRSRVPGRAGAPIDPDSEAALAQRLRSSILCWALCESVALFGVALYVLSRQTGWLYAFLASSALLLVVHAPRTPALGANPRDFARPDVKIG